MDSAPGPSLVEQRIHLKMLGPASIWCFTLDGATGAPVAHPTQGEGLQCRSVLNRIPFPDYFFPVCHSSEPQRKTEFVEINDYPSPSCQCYFWSL